MLLILFCLDESQKESSSHATSDTSCQFMLSVGEPHTRVLSAPREAGKGSLLEGGKVAEM